MNEIAITVHGTPAGQGAVSFLGKGRPAVHTNRKTLDPWRSAITNAAIRTAGTHRLVKVGDTKKKCAICGAPTARHGLLSGPLAAHLVVTVERTQAAAKRGDLWPDNRTSSDVDHHARAVLDALSASSIWHDDAQVVDLHALKVFPVTPHRDALSQPGAVIRVWQLNPTNDLNRSA